MELVEKIIEKLRVNDKYNFAVFFPKKSSMSKTANFSLLSSVSNLGNLF